MKVSYEDEDVEALCKHNKVAVKKLGMESAKKLQRRLAELHAAGVVSELAIGRPHPLEYDRAGQFAVDLHKGTRLIFRPTRKPPPLTVMSQVGHPGRWKTLEACGPARVEVGQFFDGTRPRSLT